MTAVDNRTLAEPGTLVKQGALVELAQEAADEALFFLSLEEFGRGREGAEGGVEDDFLNDGSGGFGLAGGLDARQVEAGDLETVKEQAGAAGIESVGGDAAEDLADGVLDGAAVLGEREVEGALTSAASLQLGVRDWFAGGVMVETKIFMLQAWTAAAVPIGKNMAALEAFRCSVFD